MAPDLPVLKPRKVLRALLRAGFVIHHQTGNHAHRVIRANLTFE